MQIRCEDLVFPEFISNPDPDIYLSENYWVVDLETTNIEKGRAVLTDNRVLYVAMYHPKKGWYRSIVNEVTLSEIEDKLFSADFIVAHNAKFELQWFYRAGIDISKLLVFDTMIGEYCLAGNRNRKLGLDDTCMRYKCGRKHGFISAMMSAGVCPSDMPQEAMHDYCKNDVQITHDLFRKQLPLLEEANLLPVVYTRCIYTPVLSEMEMHGLHLDKELVNEIHKETVEEHISILSELDSITGGINMGSAPQVAEFIYNVLKFDELKNRRGQPIRNKPNKKFPEGQPKTDEDTLTKLRPKNKKQKRFIELKKKESKLRKKITTYTNKFVDACENNNNMLYGSINQCIARTHRLTSSKPNLQNLDRMVKKVIKARSKGWKIRQNDYDQLEYRVAGFLAQCPVTLSCVKKGEDPHYLSASMLFEEEFTSLAPDSSAYKELRNKAKEDTFKPLYGGQTGTPKQQAYYKEFMNKHTGIQEWHNEIIDIALETDELVMPTGLKFYFPGTNYSSSGYVNNSRNIKNYPVQSFAAEIASIGTTLLWHCMKAAELKSFIINAIHDAALIEQHPKENKIMGNFSEFAMSNLVIEYLRAVYGIEYNFPLTIEGEVGTHWGWNKPN